MLLIKLSLLVCFTSVAAVSSFPKSVSLNMPSHSPLASRWTTELSDLSYWDSHICAYFSLRCSQIFSFVFDFQHLSCDICGCGSLCVYSLEIFDFLDVQINVVSPNLENFQPGFLQIYYLVLLVLPSYMVWCTNGVP